MDSSTSLGRPTGLPRPSRLPGPSKLPILNKGPAQASAQQAQARTGLVSETRAVETPRSTKRSSIASLPRPNKESAPSNTVSLPRTAAIGTRLTPRLSTGLKPRNSTLRTPSASIARPQTVSEKSHSSIPSQDEETSDQLRPLDTFRTASRQGVRDDFDSQGSADSGLPNALPAQKVRKSRPSLSDRAIESLQTVPSTPKERRQSSFFYGSESPMGPPPRPASSLSQANSNGSRPGTSDGNLSRPPLPTTRKIPASAKTLTRYSGLGFTKPSTDRRSVSTTFTSRLKSTSDITPKVSRSPSPSKRPVNGSLARGGNKPRASVKGLFAPSSSQMPETQTNTNPTATTSTSTSSAALRQQIAAARAAAKKGHAKPLHDSPMDSHQDEHDLLMEPHADPFNQTPRDGKHILRNRINAARMDGKLNISGMSLKTIPDEVRSMYNAAAIEESKVSWAEVVDLTKLIAADNEIESIPEDVFPDINPESFYYDDDTPDNQFGGLESLDMHGNLLNILPVGFRRLERLTTLNLAHNKLDNRALDTIAQMTSLKELRLGHNNISGNLPTSFCTLPSLEILDLQSNRILTIPEALCELVNLRILNVSGNQLTALPMDALVQLPLQELDASSNALIASLFPLGGPSELKMLKTLSVAHNSLAALTFSPTLELPNLHTLDLTNNHFTNLPSVESWLKLTTLMAGDNKIVELPQGFTKLRHLRTANFTGNELHQVPSEVALMESLTNLILASNPLRDKKYLTMGTADIKRDLSARMEKPADQAKGNADGDVEKLGEDTDIGSTWALRPHGLLDLSNKGLTDSVNDTLGSFLKANEVRQLKLQGNKLTTIPPALWLGQDLRILDLSTNPFDADYLSDDLELPSLTELNLTGCRVASLEPLSLQLHAPKLRSLNVTANRLSGSFPRLREVYSGLSTFLAADNKFTSLSMDALRGFNTINLKSNDIQTLPAEVGLLWDEGLKHFEISQNAFRVPGYRVLEKGTEATMRWLRDRIPTSQGAEVPSAE